MRTAFGVSFSACFNTLLTEQAALCKEGGRGELYADLTVGYDPSTEQIFAEIKDRNGELHRIFAGERVPKAAGSTSSSDRNTTPNANVRH